VAAGSSSSYGFRRLIERLIDVVPPSVEVLWQTGSTPLEGLDISAHPDLPSEELAAAIGNSDVAVIHAGVGLSLLALANGRCPVVVPRRRARGEHIDDHQVQVAAMLSSRGLAVACEVEDLSLEVLMQAAARQVTRETDPPRFLLDADRPRTDWPRSRATGLCSSELRWPP
jgi:UDP-N-acetylglucosamine transferase subunit ALG13